MATLWSFDRGPGSLVHGAGGSAFWDASQVETQVRTPQMVFMQPQRLIVPLFQRPYVWNEEKQWEPLWGDVTRVAQRLLAQPQARHQPHFLGAVVLQQVLNPAGSMQERTVIDGQQRLTTLQLLLDALHAELHTVGAVQPAMRIEALVKNAEPFWEDPADRFKVWPTNRDRPAFNCVMGAEPPVDYSGLEHSGARLVEGHRYFAERAREWLQVDGPDQVQTRASYLERSVRELLQVVVIDLTVEENAQEIFETLNARGAQLTAADLIKNFIFQRLIESGEAVESAYEQYWKVFETGFWEMEISFGRVRYARSSAFLNQWLIARTGEEIVAREVFSRFKQYADFDSGVRMGDLLAQIHRAAGVYRRFVQASETLTGPIDRVDLFAYRTSVLESEVIKPLALFLLDPEQEQIPAPQVIRALAVTESWLVRRMIVRATSKSYTQVVAELITQIRKADRGLAGDVLEEYFAAQRGANRYWPDDEEVRHELATLPAYRRLSRGRIRMILEALEDHSRGWKMQAAGLGGERVTRGKLAIEHILPRKWLAHWPLTDEATEAERDQLVHTMGNLTLLTRRLNSRVSNGPWEGAKGKRNALKAHDVLMLNRELLEDAGSSWGDTQIRNRSERLANAVLEIWPVPDGHRSGFARERERTKRKVEVADLINAGILKSGAILYARRKAYAHRTATVLPDGNIDVDGQVFSSPSGAAVSITGKSTNGWSFFLIDAGSRRSLSDLWHDYVDELSVDVDDSDAPEEDDEQ